VYECVCYCLCLCLALCVCVFASVEGVVGGWAERGRREPADNRHRRDAQHE